MKRNIKELLTIALAELIIASKKEFYFGLCGLMYNIQKAKTISVEEWEDLIQYLNTNKPKRHSLYFNIMNYFNVYGFRCREYWFKQGSVPPRKKWLQKHIQLNN